MNFNPKEDCKDILSFFENKNNHHLKFDYYKKKEEKRIKELYELGRKSNPMNKENKNAI